MKKGAFVISLDFELYWGVRDHRTLENYGDNIANVHLVVPRLLKMFRENGIHCTWATVGFLFCQGMDELKKNIPAELPSYNDESLNPYPYIQKERNLEARYHFAPDLILQIRETPGQEIGTHTLSHYYTLEDGATADSLDKDLELAVKIADSRNIKINSIVFPRNQYNDEALRICAKNRIWIFRGTEQSWIYETRSRTRETRFRRLIRLADSYINLSGHHTTHPFALNGMINTPASRFLRPYSPKLSFLEGLRLRRIKRSMRHAAKHGEMFHLWWHPHNFGSHMEENFTFLSKIIAHYKKLEQQYGMRSLNMSEIAVSAE